MRNSIRRVARRVASRSFRLATTLFATVIASAAWCDSLVNPSFELPALGSGYKYNPASASIGWVFSGSSGIEHNGSAFNAANAADGVQAAFVQAMGSIAQTLNLSAGNYVMSFKAAQRSCCVTPYPQPVRVTVDGTQIGALVSPSSTAFASFSIAFAVTSTGAHTIAFAGTDAADKTTFIDAVVITTNSAVSTSTTIASSLNPATAGSNVVFTATVTGSVPTGGVAFTADGTTVAGCAAVVLPVGGANSKSASCGTAALGVGGHLVAARYSGDAGNQASSSAALSQIVNAAPSTLLNSGFEAPVLGSGYRYNPTGTGIGWTFSPSSGI
ncbi:MAG TPA: Ig-like domain-containing protein, partial [Candidatus Cybelea sp.]|nr:Ig-like domain-containing protein [Candidatus Cybelea sp.]